MAFYAVSQLRRYGPARHAASTPSRSQSSSRRSQRSASSRCSLSPSPTATAAFPGDRHAGGLPRVLDLRRIPDGVRPARLRGRRQPRGGPSGRYQRRRHPDRSVHDQRVHGRRRWHHPRVAPALGRHQHRWRQPAAQHHRRRRHRRHEPVRRVRVGSCSAFYGALVITAIQNGMDLLGMASGTKFVVTGIVLLLAVLIDSVSKRRRAAAVWPDVETGAAGAAAPPSRPDRRAARRRRRSRRRRLRVGRRPRRGCRRGPPGRAGDRERAAHRRRLRGGPGLPPRCLSVGTAGRPRRDDGRRALLDRSRRRRLAGPVRGQHVVGGRVGSLATTREGYRPLVSTATTVAGSPT